MYLSILRDGTHLREHLGEFGVLRQPTDDAASPNSATAAALATYNSSVHADKRITTPPTDDLRQQTLSTALDDYTLSQQRSDDHSDDRRPTPRLPQPHQRQRSRPMASHAAVRSFPESRFTAALQAHDTTVAASPNL